MFARIFSRLYHACWYVLATIVLTAAVCVTLLRLMLPYIDNYREEIQGWISTYTGYSITVDKIEAEWQGWKPYLRLKDINVLDQGGQNTLTRLQSATISLNPATMLIRQNLSPLNITIAGPELVIVRELDGAINIAQIERGGSKEYIQDKHSVFAEWLLAQRSVSIQNAKIHYVDEKHADKSLQLTGATLLFKRHWKHIQIDVSATLPQELGTSFQLSMEAFGDITTPQWSGQIYFNGNRLYPAALLALIHDGASPVKLASAPGNIHLWSNWTDGKLINLDGWIDMSEMRFAYGKLNYNIEHINTLFSIRRDADKGFKLRLNIEDLVTANGAWPGTSIEIHKESIPGSTGFRYAIKSDYLRIEDLLPLLESVQAGDKGTAITLSGGLVNTLVVYDESQAEPLYINANADNLTIRFNGINSHITNISGHVESGLDKGLIRLESGSVELVMPDILAEPVMLYELSGDIIWRKEGELVTLETSLIESHSPHFNSSLRGSVSYNHDNNTLDTDLLFRAVDINIENIAYYMPVHTPEELQAWIKSALVSGQISSLDMLLRGKPEEFPFKNLEGQFRIVANVQNVTMDYHPDWTPADKLDAELVLDNNRLLINAHGGYIYNAAITHAEAVVEALDADNVAIDIKGNVKGNTQDAIFIVENSPLNDSGLFREINNHRLDGPISLNLDLHIPLDHRPVSLNGDMFFDNTFLTSPAIGVELYGITGNVLFTRDSVSSRDLRGNYFDQEISLDIHTDEGENLVFSISGNSDGDFISGQLVHFFPAMDPVTARFREILDGSCRWTATLTPAPAASGNSAGFSRLLNIKSDLSGLGIRLPAPLGKDLDTMPLEISTVISDSTQKEIHISLGNDIAGKIHIGRNGDIIELTRAELALGANTGFFNEGHGILIHGKTGFLSLSDWHTLIDTLDLNIADDSTDLVRVDLFVSSLGYYDQKFADTHFALNNTQTHWQAVFGGPDIEGEMLIPRNNLQGSVKANFKKLYLQKPEDTEHVFDIDPRGQPPLALTADDFSYGTINLGKLVLNTSSRADGVSIDTISFEKPGMTINGSGQWQMVDNLEFSRFEFKLVAEQLETMLKTFDYSVAPIDDGATILELSAVWNGSPMDFSLEKINGNLEMSIEKGTFLNIEPAAGRLFGLLSLQTLPRRLSLDFSDLFGKGFTFDSIEGSFTLESGNAYTNNLSMIGPSADIGITGRTGLIEKDYDQIVTVTPQVSDSLPLASALFGPIGAGVGAVLFLAGELFQSIPKQIDKLLRYQYTIRGSWDDPLVEKYTGEGSG
jgi:uncharacterized protein (TIGR02099 family)